MEEASQEFIQIQAIKAEAAALLRKAEDGYGQMHQHKAQGKTHIGANFEAAKKSSVFDK